MSASRFSVAALAAALSLATSVASARSDDPIGALLGGSTAAERDVEVTGSVDAAPEAGRAHAAAPVRVASPQPPAQDYPVDLLISLANDAVFTPDPYPKGRRSDPRMIKLQVLLDRNNASTGVIDGIFGDNVVKGVMAFEEMQGHQVDGRIDPEIWAALERTSAEPVLVPYTITPEDVAGPFVPTMPQDYAEQAQLPGLAYRDAAEMLAERFHMDEAFLRRLNPDVTFAEAGAEIIVANPGKPLKAKVAHIIADKARKQIRGYDDAGKLIVAYPATIGSSDMPSPTGTHAVKAIAINPDYWYRPKVNFVQGTNTSALRLPPGPNGPVGATWVGLDKPTYGLHGTPEPSKIDKTNSHGCVRLTNWDARELAGLVQPGVPVDFQEPPSAPAEDAPVAETPAPSDPVAEAPPVAAPPLQRAPIEVPNRIPLASERRAER
ncbi:L,D-transpeptidase family protein [Hansschlegelia quercus]|uniref:Murein L,D-transpeptidase n=1 Tax=Hansschlegelia quercus TaxID=2528245 RepID=A0A4Q9GDI3_9HYPH|nr:L,D-transpeptidase [Hansschlegelia quercus]TBN48290.1 murein L,D-transpeptidase [Hansschlegelia quercus]